MDARPDDGSRPPVPDQHPLAAEVARRRSEVDHLHRALASRAVIEQAKGILAERTRSSAQDAFRLLDEMSQRPDLELRRIAAELVTERGGVVGPDLLAEDDAPEPAGGG